MAMCKEIEVLIKNYKTNYTSKMRKGVNTPTKKKNIELSTRRSQGERKVKMGEGKVSE